MTQPLPFFPASLPDETLASRASRLHILRGNSTDQFTFKELFGRSQLAIGRIVPANLDVLANRLPGLPLENLRDFIKTNTLFPLFRPFLGRADHSSPPLSDSALDMKLSRILVTSSVPRTTPDYVWPVCTKTKLSVHAPTGIARIRYPV